MTKKIVAGILIAMLSLQCFYKLACVTYYQLNKDYIAEFLCVNRDNPITVCYGQCLLKTALGFDADTNANAMTSNLKFELPAFKLNEPLSISKTNVLIQSFPTGNCSLNTSSFIPSVFRPPLFDC